MSSEFIKRVACLVMLVGVSFDTLAVEASTAGAPASNELAIVANGKSAAIILRAANAGKWERAAAEDLVHYIAEMTHATVPVADTPEAIASALESDKPLIILGQEALALKPELNQRLKSALKPAPTIRSDGIALVREKNRIYVTGNNDEADYFAAAELLRRWGVRWFMPGEFGESVPNEPSLSVGDLDYLYSSPFEVRSYWISWLGDATGVEIFQKRNMMTDRMEVPPNGHALGEYTKGLGKSEFNVPLSDPRTTARIVEKVGPAYAAGKDFSLSISDGLYDSPDEADQKLLHLQWDKYFLSWSVTDAILKLYANVAHALRENFPTSVSRVGFLIYANMTLPPVIETTIDPMFFGVLAPIDFDPIHAMDDPRAPDKGELRGILQKWASLLPGRLAIYDYDQSMLVWRDLPNPSHMAFSRDVKIYRDAGALGFVTESRNALATTFLNIYMRGRLMWEPDSDPQALLDDFYPRFFGPAAAPMKAYWDAIFKAWSETIVTEHEFFVAPAIYSPRLLAELEKSLKSAEDALAPLRARPEAELDRNGRLYLKRLAMVDLGFQVLRNYMDMVGAASTEVDYAAAVQAGEKGLKARDALTALDKAFTTTRLEAGPAFWPGEVQQYHDLLSLTDGDKGRLIEKLPLEWAFRRDPRGDGEQRGFASEPVDLSYWNGNRNAYTIESRKDYPDQWETLRTNLYVQAQGVRFADGRNYVGDIWYRTTFSLTPAQVAAAPHLMFPGLFNSCDLFMDGRKIAERAQKALLWHNDYRFEWDVPLTDVVSAGGHVLALRCHVPVHLGGIFRRPFLYSALTAR